MKILQLNMWGGKLGKQIVEVLKREEPDVVCLQEAVVCPGDQTIFFLTLDELLAQTAFSQHFYSPVFSFRYMNRTAQFGNAILSTLPFAQTNVVFTRLEFVEEGDLLDADLNVRNLQHVTVSTEDGPLHVLNHHGHHIGAHKKGDAETLRQCAMIRDYIEKLEGKVVLTGDFNLEPHSESLEQLNAVLTNHCIEAGLTTTRTPLTKKTEVCDYIFTNDKIDVRNFRALDDMVSDHQALVMEFV